MSMHSNAIFVGALLTVPLTGDVRCGNAEPDDVTQDATDDATFDALDGAMDEALQDLLMAEGEPVENYKSNPVKSLEALGKFVFFDRISDPAKTQGCADCHDPGTGWTLRNETINKKQVVAPGAAPGVVGNIKPPTNAYAHRIPPFGTVCSSLPLPFFCGGAFWDGRAENNEDPLGDPAVTPVGEEVFQGKTHLESLYAGFLGPLADQATQPFVNPLEQNIGQKQVCKHVAKSKYAPLYTLAWGQLIDCSDKGHKISFKRIALALAAYQASDEVNSFSSKRDAALKAEIELEGQAVAFPLTGLTDQENLGHDLFYSTIVSDNPLEIGGQVKITNCALCHSEDPVTDDGTELFQLYTDNGFHNIGTPRNHEIPGDPGDAGLGARIFLDDPNDGIDGNALLGQFKTPTLRNVDKRPDEGFVKAYTHNGWFKSLKSLVHFYNTANVDGATAAAFGVTRCDPDQEWTEQQALEANCWPEPGATGTLAIGPLIGDMGLTEEEEDAIVAYLKTFTDSKTVKPPKLFK